MIPEYLQTSLTGMERSTVMVPWRGSTAIVTTVSVSMASGLRVMGEGAVGAERATELLQF